MKHTWGPEHRSKHGRRINVCARCGLVREKLWSYGDGGMRKAYRREDGTLIGTKAPVCEATQPERTDDGKRTGEALPRLPEAREQGLG